MLTQVYRFGSARQRVLKGLIVHADNPTEVLNAAVRQLPAETARRIHRDQTRPAAVWVDSGLAWLHTAAHRQNCFSSLATAIQQLQSAVQRAGGRLLPNAVRDESQTNWDNCLCGDIHFLETMDDNEKEVFCNLLRQELPVLIMATGRSGATALGVESVGSRRLLEESRLLAARYFASVSPKHLERVTQCLRREQGVSRLESLDVGPIAANGSQPGGVEIRFTDGQVLLSTVRAQTLLYQALLIQARRKARDGKRVGNVPQGLVERNRARAIADGIRAQLELDQSRPADHQPRGPRTRESGQFRLGREALSSLLESLRYEFQALEAEFFELAPLALGVGLRTLGLAGLQNESEWLLGVTRNQNPKSRAKSGELQGQAQWGNWVTSDSGLGDDPITAANRSKFPAATKRIEAWWEQSLHSPLVSQSKPRSRPKPSQPPGPSRPNDRPPAPATRNNPREANSPTRAEAKPPSSKPSASPTTDAKTVDAARLLCRTLIELGPAAPNRQRADALLAFFDASECSHLPNAARSVSRQEWDQARSLLQSALGPSFDIEPMGASWDLTEVQRATEIAQQTGLSLLRVSASAEHEKDVRGASGYLTKWRPPSIQTFFWNLDRTSDGQVAVELLLVSRNSGVHPK